LSCQRCSGDDAPAASAGFEELGAQARGVAIGGAHRLERRERGRAVAPPLLDAREGDPRIS
jgi:hypothetical protein